MRNRSLSNHPGLYMALGRLTKSSQKPEHEYVKHEACKTFIFLLHTSTRETKT